MKKHVRLSPIAVIAACALTACASPSTANSDPLAENTDTAKGLLAARLATTADQVSVVTAEQVTWPNGAAGCPRAGMGYTQALVPGYRIVLQYNGADYHYHGVNSAAPFFCARPGPKSGWIQDR